VQFYFERKNVNYNLYLILLLLLLLLLQLHPFNSLFSRTTCVSRYQKGKTSLDLNEARDSGVLGCSRISWTICKQSAPLSRCITTPTPHHSIFTGCSLWRPANWARALKDTIFTWYGKAILNVYNMHQFSLCQIFVYCLSCVCPVIWLFLNG